ncbi:hypothetical protein [Streptomyces sp. BE303]|uniref:hypothetical protein n=1 Tax=Streptomyces sp. BE303 TaxID=3002528 RepID=UPI002E759A2B|nr:hypothetical protein [Streptomyces sp. BE303]MED7948127.1 hypothetical protein [Streptomyces sp. BE303]
MSEASVDGGRAGGASVDGERAGGAPVSDAWPGEGPPGDGPADTVAPIEVPCPQCAVPADPETLRCPSCREDLAALVRLRYAGRIDYNEALELARSGDGPSALVLLRRALAVEPDLHPARELFTAVSARLAAARRPAD